MALVDLYADGRVLMAHDDALFLCAWADAPEMTQMRALGDHGRRVEASHGPLALLNVAFSGVPKFSDEVRACSAAYTRDAALFARSRAHVVLLPGFRGAAVMAFINTFLLVGRPPRPTKVFRAVDPAIEWTARLLPSHDDAAISAALEQLRGRLPLAE
ncbi:MAG: hypothetical protein IPH07_12905 [Deltaproteobacteria bacterium]|nr:hypothetical protein [Deltaproteobacteria bacterium]MBK8717031.1 hypothetical protein [Deltaproteobacteria bacterium]MBP7290624.1 hypothetical protein [Nannocystaceae bacterium]